MKGQCGNGVVSGEGSRGNKETKRFFHTSVFVDLSTKRKSSLVSVIKLASQIEFYYIIISRKGGGLVLYRAKNMQGVYG